MQTWCAIGDSFTYLNDHLDETGNIVARGYLSRALDKLPPLCLRNLGINGSTTRDWLTAPLAPADVYTILLGTNDWHQGIYFFKIAFNFSIDLYFYQFSLYILFVLLNNLFS